MKPDFRLASFLAAIGCSFTPVSAETFHWDGSSNITLGSSDNTNTVSQNWLSGGLWDNGTTSAALGSWTAGDSAVFGGSAASQTIALGSGITVGNLTFGSGGSGSGTSGTAYTISGGTLTFSGTTLAVNTATVITSAISNAGTATISGPGALTLRGGISGTGTLNHSGSGLLTLSAADGGRDYFGALTGTGSIRVGTSGGNFYGLHGSLSGLTGTINMAGLVHNRASALGSTGAAFVQESGGTWLVSNDDVANLNVTYHMGSLSGSGTIAGSGYVSSRSGTKTLSIGALNTDTTYSGSITNGFSGGGSTIALTKVGTGTLTLSGSNSYTSGTTISSGTIVANSGNALGTGGTVTLNDAATGANQTRLLLGSVTMGRAITVANQGSGTVTLGANGSVANPTFSGAITLNRDVTLDGSTNTDRLTFTGAIGGTGNITIAGTGRVMFLQASNTFNGNLTINNGATLQLDWGDTGSFNYIPDASIVTANGMLKLTQRNGTETIGGLAGNGTVRAHEGVANSAVSLVVNSSTSNTFSGIIQNGGASGSSVSLTKTGAGTQTLSGANTYTAGTTIRNGVLALAGGDNRLATTGSVTLGGTGTSGKLVLGDGGSAVSQTLAGLTTTGNGGSVVGGHVSDSTLTLNIASNNVFGGVLGGGGTNENNLALVKSGAGTLTLSGTNTHTGATSIAAGTLDVTGSTGAGSAVSVAGSATLKGTGTVGGTVTVASGGIITGGDGTTGTLTLGNLTFNGNGTVNIGTLANYTGTAAVNITGTLNPNGNIITLNMPTGSANGGTYQLLGTSYNSLAGIALGTTPALTSRQSGSLSVTASHINYVITGVNPYWTGKAGTEWSTATLGEPKNWETAPGVTTDYLATDAVTFDDNATGTSVDIPSNVSPTDVIFNHSAKNFTLTGAAGIAGTTSLTKSGTGTLDVGSANSYSGTTTINGGVLRLGGASALGSTSGSTTVASGAVLDLNGQTIGAEALTLHGTGVSSGGALVNTSGSAASLAGNITLGATSSIGGAGDTTLSGTVGGGHGLAKVGSGTLTLAGANTYTGTTSLTAGTIHLAAAETAGTSGPLGGSAAVNPGSIVMNGGTLRYSATNQNDYSGRFGAAANQQFNVDTNGQNVTWSTALASSGGSLTKSGSGTLSLSGQNTYNGTTTINGGVLNLTMGIAYTPSKIGSEVVINSGGSLVLNAYFQTGFAYNLAGNVAPANITVNAGGTFNKNGQATYIQNLTINGNGAVTGAGGAGNDNLQLCGDVTATSTSAGAPSISSLNLVAGDYTNAGNTRTFHVTHGAGSSSAVDLSVGAIGQQTPGPAANLVKTGGGTMEITGAGAYTGTTLVSAGRLVISGSISTSTQTTVQSGAVIAGTGTVGTLTILDGGTLAPGNSPGTLTTGTLTLADASISTFEFDPLNQTAGGGINDLVNVTGNLTLDGILHVIATSGNFLSATVGNTWRLFDYTGTLTDNTLSFGTMPALGGGLSWEVDTSTAGQVNLTVIPEPRAALLGGIGLLMLLRRRRA